MLINLALINSAKGKLIGKVYERNGSARLHIRKPENLVPRRKSHRVGKVSSKEAQRQRRCGGSKRIRKVTSFELLRPGTERRTPTRGKTWSQSYLRFRIFLILFCIKLGLMLASGYKYKPCNNVQTLKQSIQQTGPVPPFESSRVVEFFERAIRSIDLRKFRQPYLSVQYHAVDLDQMISSLVLLCLVSCGGFKLSSGRS